MRGRNKGAVSVCSLAVVTGGVQRSQRRGHASSLVGTMTAAMRFLYFNCQHRETICRIVGTQHVCNAKRHFAVEFAAAKVST